ncbi:copper resistance protein NlpE [Sphingobacterium sp. UT-1RO-CII-1]|uniref:copper resistance protein NlpE n=1 Tax=Sphingobacterium sp. UT-1RO-CII-1 TaxID=2995225 RepID=UPI00227A0D61|nr:copper resistance protein NlpE [Sphingobacterium sp. UT-1RO-CII-1]MCY4780724.1 copper resistance protein NlpE [Sphingobacterium sp. UT-1RO-CII-1]
MNKIFLVGLSMLVLASCNQNSSKKEEVTTQDSTNVEAFADTTHTSQNSVDWAGVYDGTIPCADCEGIKTMIELKDDGTFTMETEYLGKDGKFSDKGVFTWFNNGSSILLKGEGEEVRLKVGENQLFHLDQEGNEITGELAEQYIYKKRM